MRATRCSVRRRCDRMSRSKRCQWTMIGLLIGGLRWQLITYYEEVLLSVAVYQLISSFTQVWCVNMVKKANAIDVCCLVRTLFKLIILLSVALCQLISPLTLAWCVNMVTSAKAICVVLWLAHYSDWESMRICVDVTMKTAWSPQNSELWIFLVC